jgi:2-C-methyl-D-erythritol 2,4-cyclodiphosphate synthase
MSFRIGFGFDVHQLVEGREFWLGGIKIPFNKGGLGHSDADVLIHVICDALLGAANLGDIGKHFPDSSDEYKDVDSKILLEKVMVLIRKDVYEIGNNDSTICLQTPKLETYIDSMKGELSRCMSITPDIVSIKATTTEKLGFVGKEKGISAYATVLINKVRTS